MIKDYIELFGYFVGAIISLVFVFLLIFCIIAFPTMWLWNYCIPDITNHQLKEINVYQAFALVVLTRFLFLSSFPTKEKK